MTIRQRAARADYRRRRADSATMLNQIRFALVALVCGCPLLAADLHLNDLDYFEAQGLSVLAYQNTFHEVFRDQKLGGVEIILHGERIATDGEVRLLPTPEQWDPVPKFTARQHGAVPDQAVSMV
jgi:endoglucanase